MMKARRITGRNALTGVFLLVLAAVFVMSIPFAVEKVGRMVAGSAEDARRIHSSFESDYGGSFPARKRFIDVNGLMARTLQKRELNYTYRMADGGLGSSSAYYDVTPVADSVAGLRDYLAENGIALVFMMMPAKEAMPEAELPQGIENASKRIVSDMTRLLAERGVTVLDLPALMQAEGMTAYDDYYHTDHHWRTETAFWATEQLMTLLRDAYGIPYDLSLYDLSRYQIDAYPQSFLGSKGSRTGALFAGVDDFNLPYPKYATHMTVDIWKRIVNTSEEDASVQGGSARLPAADMHRAGSFYEANIFPEHLERNGYYLDSAYFAYLDNNYALVRHANEDAPARQSMVMIKDSFGRAVEAYLSLQLTRVDAIDPRSYVSGCLAADIVGLEPDVVVLCINSDMYATPAFFDYGL